MNIMIYNNVYIYILYQLICYAILHYITSYIGNVYLHKCTHESS